MLSDSATDLFVGAAIDPPTHELVKSSRFERKLGGWEDFFKTS